MLLNQIRRQFSLQDARLYWLFAACCGLYVVLGRINTPDFALPILASLVFAGLVLHQSGYGWTSFVTIFTLTHVIAFPVGTLLVLSLNSASLAIEPEVWDTAPLGLWGMVVGMSGLAIGARLGRLRLLSDLSSKLQVAPDLQLTPVWFNLGLSMLIIPLVISDLSAGIYYHKDVTGVDDYNSQNAAALGFMGYLAYMSYGGVVLQIRRYLGSRSRRDLNYLFLCLAIPLIVILPSGTRARILVIVAIALIYYLKFENRSRVKFIVLGVATSLLLVLTLSIAAYRISTLDTGATTFASRMGNVLSSITVFEKNESSEAINELARAQLGRRLSDHHSVGHLIDVIPEVYPHRGVEGMLDFGYYLLPTVFRPEISLDFNYDAILMMEKYQFRTEIGGSSPMLVIGELYERFGWPGIAIGMLVIGYFLTCLDRWIGANTVKGALIWAMFFYAVINMYAYSLLKIFTLGTRQFIIFLIITFVLDKVLNVFSSRRLHR